MIRKLLTVLAVLVVLAVLAVGVVRWQWDRTGGASGSNQPGAAPPAAAPPAPPADQPQWCPAVEMISAPGTWESAPTDDPFNPTANPNSLMLQITGPLQERFSPQQVRVWTLPYPAQFRNINAPHEMSYDDSRDNGAQQVRAHMSEMHAQCPATDFIMAGFSQGAVIVGDLAAELGTGSGFVPAERVRGVLAIADGRRVPGVGQQVGNPVAGVGAEVALQPLSAVVQPVVPGASMRGERPGGFGLLDARVVEVCAPDDSICDAPRDVGNALGRAQALISANGVHALYATNPNVIPGTTATQWAVGWAAGLVEPPPAP